ncbi:hypothetical protein QBC38DRAFT_496096 [Podospora fimiseda]|uniref:BTB domain transcription factor n=1 Tax=Podospora fimiseda TaxID=252190 RepID=A0AAN7BWK3_9PEZI|nr:hypothetical protein QBC38DRAFT_496096 [Podospora fimiseda]
MTTSTNKTKAQEGAPPASEAETGSKHEIEEGAPSPEAKRLKKTESAPEEAVKPEGKAEEENPVPDQKKTEKNEEAEEEKPAPEQKKKEEDKEESEAVEPHESPESIPSSVVEKGIIYFFFRGRVNIDEPSKVNEIARSYIILRPIAKDAQLRLCVIPKKVLPQTGNDRWVSIVEKTGDNFQKVKEEFLAANDYETKTAGTRHSPAATPIGEGVYAIMNTGKESHLVYVLTLPRELGEVQKEIGLKERGSFVISTRNPEYEPPKNARLPKGPEYPKEILDEFRSLRWAPTQPKHLGPRGLKKALEPQEKDKKEGKDEPVEELEKLEEEDYQRMKDLTKDDATRIFTDL